MIGYCPIDELDVVPEKKRVAPVSTVSATPGNLMDENTECNYVVMFFIVGVIALAAMDAVKK
jgi:hypothetical protein